MEGRRASSCIRFLVNRLTHELLRIKKKFQSISSLTASYDLFERRIFNQEVLYPIFEERDTTAKCEHKSCGSAEKVWLPYVFQGRELGLKPHPYCSECGAVKNLSSERPREIGFYVNVVVALSKCYKVAQVQMRLIAMEMERLDLDDKYTLDRHQQEELFITIVKKYVNVPEVVLRGQLEL